MDKTLDGIDGAFDFVDENLLGRAPEQEKEDSMNEFEMYASELLDIGGKTSNVMKKIHEKIGRGKKLTLGSLITWSSNKKRMLKGLPMEGRR